MSLADDNASTDPVDRITVPALAVGVAGLVVWLAGTFFNPQAGMRSYLVAFELMAGFSIGGLGLAMLHHLVGGAWGVVIRRPLESAAANMWLVAVLFLPIVVGLHMLYPWAWGPYLSKEIPAEIMHHLEPKKLKYLNPSFFMTRQAAYFILWVGLGLIFSRFSRAQDQTSDQTVSKRLQALAGPGLVIGFITVSLASVDWQMSLEPNWASTIYGPLFIIGCCLQTFAGCIALTAYLVESGRRPELNEVATKGRFQDLGNLMLAFTMLWAYMSFSQFLIIWAGDLREEIPFYTRRLRGGWQWVALFIILFHFFGPFFALLNSLTKRTPRVLAALGLFVVAMHYVDLYWQVVPSAVWPSPRAEPGMGRLLLTHWTAPFALVGVGGIWLWGFTRQLRNRPPVLINDPSVALAVHEDQTSHAHGYS